MKTNETMMNLILLVFFIGIIYFMMIRPQRKRDKEAKEMRDGLTRGDEIITIGGFIGKVVAINSDTVVINLNAGKGSTNVELLKTAIGSVKTPNTAARQEKKEAAEETKERDVKTSTTKKVTPKKLTPKKDESENKDAE